VPGAISMATPAVLDIERLRGQGDSPEALREVAREFEALLIGQLLKSVRAAGRGWLGSEDSEAGSLLVEVGEQQLARALAAGGGLGLADLIVSGLAGRQPPGQGPGTRAAMAAGPEAPDPGSGGIPSAGKVAIMDSSALFHDGVLRSTGPDPAAGRHQSMEDNSK